MAVKAGDLEQDLIESLGQTGRPAARRRVPGRPTGVRAPVLPLGAGQGPRRPRPGRPVRRRRRPLAPRPAARARARPRSASTTRSASATAGPRRYTVVEIVSDDMPFIVDSVTMELSRQGYDDRADDPPGDARRARRATAS